MNIDIPLNVEIHAEMTSTPPSRQQIVDRIEYLESHAGPDVERQIDELRNLATNFKLGTAREYPK